ncbi:MAG: frr [Alphaproteobacteria bacterium]|nr:frr [Alphaproteobacteria bacterium]
MAFDLNELKRKMEAAVDALKKEFSGLRSGRASTGMLDPIQVESYGSMMPLNQVANISTPEPRLLTVTVWDRGMVTAVEKAIRDSGLGLNPQTEGSTIRLPIPAMTEERRKEMTKVAGKYAEAAKVAIRNIRREGMDNLKKQEKDSQISEDERERHEKDLQKATDEAILKVDTTTTHKEKEIMEV